MNKNNCQVHSNRPLTFVCTDPKQKNSLKCVSCVLKEKINLNHLIPIVDIVESNNKTIFLNWPLQNDEDYIQEIENISMKSEDETLKEKINIYFNELRQNMNEVINKLQKDMLMKANQLWNFNEKIIHQYNQLSSKEQIKTLLLDYDIPYEHKNNQLKEIINQIVNNQKPYKEAIKISLDTLKAQESAIDFENPTKIKQQIMNLMDEINFFLVEDLQELHFEDQIAGGAANNDSIQAIMSLIGNKFNRCSPDFLVKIEAHLKKYSLIMKKFDMREFRMNDLELPSLESLTNEDLDEIMDITRIFINNKSEIPVQNKNKQNKGKELIKPNQVDVLMRLAKNKFNYCSNEYLERLETHLQRYKTLFNRMDVGVVHANNFVPPQIDKLDDLDFKEMTNILTQIIHNKEQVRANQVNILKTDDLMRLIGNKINYCSNDFLNQSNKILKGVERYINSFQAVNIYQNGKKQLTCFDNLTDSQVINISVLADKISELTHHHGNNYTTSLIPQPLIQKSSNMLSKCILNNLPTSQIQGDQVNQILVNYPIFDTIDIQPFTHRKISMPFIKTTLQNSQQLQITGDESGYLIQQPNSLDGQAVSDFPLDNNLAYIIRCTFNRPYDCGYIRIGLVEQSQMHISCVNSDNVSGFISHSSYSKQCIKGESLECDKLKKIIKCLEFRICVCNDQFYFADYADQLPRYNHINAVAPGKFDKNKSYRFGVFFCTPGNDWSVRVDNVMVLVDKTKLSVFE